MAHTQKHRLQCDGPLRPEQAPATNRLAALLLLSQLASYRLSVRPNSKIFPRISLANAAWQAVENVPDGRAAGIGREGEEDSARWGRAPRALLNWGIRQVVEDGLADGGRRENRSGAEYRGVISEQQRAIIAGRRGSPVGTANDRRVGADYVQ